jgi:hypothetical protein
MKVLGIVLCASLLASCDETSRRFVSVPMLAERAGDTTFMVDDFEVTLTRAEVAVGPIYFCATAAADADLCHVAVAELREVSVVDLLDDDAQRIGSVEATTGMVRSATLDYGRPWLLPASQPERGPRALDGHSAIFEGEACRDDACFTFEAQIDLTPRQAGDVTVPGLDTTFAITEGQQRLALQIDAVAWLDRVDFAELAAQVNEDAVARIGPGSQAYETIVLAMTSRSVPQIEWRQD